MSSFNIYKSDGTLTLPNGASINSQLTLDDFRSAIQFAGAKDASHGTPPWVHLRFLPGYVDDHELIAIVCFYEQQLISTKLTINLYKPGKSDWTDFSPETEMQTKALHEKLLIKLLGSPARYGSTEAAPPTDETERLNCPSYWDYHWGHIASHHDSKGGGTFITFEYGDRMEAANHAYAQRSR